jgi:CPA1 family monovalent cation:H+ antiporter
VRRLQSLRPAFFPPYQVVLAVFGIVIGFVPGLPHASLRGDIILALFVPPLVFEGALNLNFKALLGVARAVALLATLGVVVSIGVVGGLAHFLLRLEWPDALLLGAILSPTDPIAVVGVVRRSAAPPSVAALLEGESLFNDGIGAAAFVAVLAVIATGHFSVVHAGLELLWVTALGAAIGVAFGVVGGILVRATRFAPLEVFITLVAAYGSYALAYLVGAAGVMAVVAAGVAMARVGTWGPDTEHSWARIVIVLNAVLYTLIGVSLPAAAVAAQWHLVVAVFAILLASRLLPVSLFGFETPTAWRLLVWWGGVRGALSIALAAAAAGTRGVGSAIPVISYGVVTLSLVLQGSLVRPAVHLIRSTSKPPSQ